MGDSQAANGVENARQEKKRCPNLVSRGENVGDEAGSVPRSAAPLPHSHGQLKRSQLGWEDCAVPCAQPKASKKRRSFTNQKPLSW
jgi:hypothetical protein